MKKILLILPLIMLMSCGNGKDANTITLMTYNVSNFSRYMENCIPDVANVIKEQEASYVSLNELDSCNLRHNSYQVEELAQELGNWGYEFSGSFAYKGGSYGNGVVTNREIIKRDILHLEKEDGKEYRSVCVVETSECVFASVHLDYKGEVAPRHQMEAVNEWFKSNYSNYPKPVFICGDFNAEPDDEVLLLAKKEWNLLTVTDYTFPTDAPCKCIDFIFAFKDAAPVEVVESQVITDGTINYSDHFPILVRVKF